MGTVRTLTVAAVAGLVDTDFRDITIAGAAAPISGTRVGDCGGNSGITFDAPKTVYHTLPGAINWSDVGWSTTNGGSPLINNMPLPQDTATINNNGRASNVTFDNAWNLGTLDMSSRTVSLLVSTSNGPFIYSSWTNSSAIIMAGAGALTFMGRGTQTLTSSGTVFVQSVTVNNISGTVRLADDYSNPPSTTTLTSGTLDLNSHTASTLIFSSSVANTRTIAFGSSGKIVVTGNNATVLSLSTSTGLTTTGSKRVEANFVGSVGTRTFTGGSTGATESTVIDLFVTAGTDTLALTATQFYGTLDFTGFAGTLSNAANTLFRNLNIPAAMTVAAGASVYTFAATSGTKTITMNGHVAIGLAFTFNGIGGTWQLQDALTTTGTITLTNGSLDFNGKTLTCGAISTSNSNTRTLAVGSATSVITGSGAAAFNAGTATGLTVTGAGIISMTSSSAKTFAGGGGTYPFTLNQGGSGALTISGSNTFLGLSNSVQPATITLTAGTTQNLTNFSLGGTMGNLITLGSTTTSQANLRKTSGTVLADYLAYSYTNVGGGAIWTTTLNSVDNGNNTGWNLKGHKMLRLSGGFY